MKGRPDMKRIWVNLAENSTSHTLNEHISSESMKMSLRQQQSGLQGNAGKHFLVNPGMLRNRAGPISL